ncbi:hypothetical protein ACTFIU_004175 [Dictyostelium citrinum]
MKSIIILLLINLIIIVVKCRDQSVLTWMGLERTNETITSDLEQILSLTQILDSVAFERFNLGPNSTLIVNNFTDVQYPLQSAGLKTLPMVSTCCPFGRPEVIEYARQLINNPQPFIDSAIQHAIDEGFDGWNIDIEPVGGNEQDSIGYAKFIDLFATQLHQHNKTLTVCAATWTPFWNLSLLAQTSVDKIYTMSTYAGTFQGFQSALQFAIQSIPLNKLAVGVMTVDENNQPFSTQELSQRFQLIINNNIKSLGIWSSPIPSNWLPFLKQFVSS